MRIRVMGLFACALMAAGLLVAPNANAANDTKVDLLHDCGPNSPEGPCDFANRDMAGPEVGFVNYNQNGQGDLLVVSAIKKAEPNRVFDFILYCGPTHANAINIAHFEPAAVTTNVVGNGNTGAILVTADELLTACGPGAHTGHVDLDTTNGDATLAATPINFTA